MMKMNKMTLTHAVVVVLALVLIAVSSGMAYPLSDLNQILFLGGAAVVLDVLMLTVCKKGSVLRDALMLGTVVLAALCLCRTLTGRADLMGYVWFSDLEKGNPTAVTSLNFAAGSMGCFLLAGILNIISGFRK